MSIGLKVNDMVPSGMLGTQQWYSQPEMQQQLQLEMEVMKPHVGEIKWGVNVGTLPDGRMYWKIRQPIKEVLTTTGITATAGIGTNMYLAKVAMDITAKKMPADENGVRIAELDEMSYRRELWTHRPLTDFWMVGRGISKKLEDNYMFTMGDVARCSQYNEAKVGTEITEGENELWL